MAWWVLIWLVLGGFYLVLAGEVSLVESTGAFVCASLGTAIAYGLAEVARRRFVLRPAAHALARYVAALGPDTISVGRQLVLAIFAAKDQRGGFVRQAFDPGPGDDATATGRRALAVLGLSLAPGTFVVRGERSETMILHALPPKPASPDRRWPT